MNNKTTHYKRCVIFRKKQEDMQSEDKLMKLIIEPSILHNIIKCTNQTLGEMWNSEQNSFLTCEHPNGISQHATPGIYKKKCITLLKV